MKNYKDCTNYSVSPGFHNSCKKCEKDQREKCKQDSIEDRQELLDKEKEIRLNSFKINK